jgi:hypothetical protein
MKHGELHHSNQLRWCDVCDCDHGPLYPCINYPPELLKSIENQTLQYQSNLMNPVWLQRQLDNEAPPEALKILGAMFGVNVILPKK